MPSLLGFLIVFVISKLSFLPTSTTPVGLKIKLIKMDLTGAEIRFCFIITINIIIMHIITTISFFPFHPQSSTDDALAQLVYLIFIYNEKI